MGYRYIIHMRRFMCFPTTGGFLPTNMKKKLSCVSYPMLMDTKYKTLCSYEERFRITNVNLKDKKEDKVLQKLKDIIKCLRL